MSGETLKMTSVFLSLLSHSNVFIETLGDRNDGG